MFPDSEPLNGIFRPRIGAWLPSGSWMAVPFCGPVSVDFKEDTKACTGGGNNSSPASWAAAETSPLAKADATPNAPPTYGIAPTTLFNPAPPVLAKFFKALKLAILSVNSEPLNTFWTALGFSIVSVTPFINV